MWYVIILIYLDLPDSDLWSVDGSSRSVMRACCDCNSSCHGRNAHKIGPFKAKRATKCGRLPPRRFEVLKWRASQWLLSTAITPLPPEEEQALLFYLGASRATAVSLYSADFLHFGQIVPAFSAFTAAFTAATFSTFSHLASGLESDSATHNGPTHSHIKHSKWTHHGLGRHIPSSSAHHNEASRLKRLLALIPWQASTTEEDGNGKRCSKCAVGKGAQTSCLAISNWKFKVLDFCCPCVQERFHWHQ